MLITVVIDGKFSMILAAIAGKFSTYAHISPANMEKSFPCFQCLSFSLFWRATMLILSDRRMINIYLEIGDFPLLPSKQYLKNNTEASLLLNIIMINQ